LEHLLARLDPSHEPSASVLLLRFLPGWPYRFLTFAFLLASFSHLWLDDATLASWMPANIVYVLGLLVMVWRPGLLAWSLCATGLAIPLFFLRDQLTQSVFLLFICGAAIVEHLRFWRGHFDASAVFMQTVRWLTVITYTMAAFHKLNRDFINPVTSCANYGINELIVYWGMPRLAFLDPVWPWLAICIEATIALLFLMRRHRLAWSLGIVFHIPLTLTMAPAFVFVMFVGWAAFATDEDLVLLRNTIRRHGTKILPGGMVLCALSLWAYGKVPEPTMIPRELLLWTLLILLFVTFPIFKRTTWERAEKSRFSAWSLVFAGLFLANTLSPYTGLQYQHAAAMLSNLRIDEGCWNHVVVPESARIREDYIRIDEGWFGKPGVIEEYEHIMKDQLWNVPQIRQMQRNWCKHEVRPLYIRGTYRGKPFEIADLCPAPGSKVLPPLPFDDSVFGIELFPEYLRFQKNLERECPQACIH